MSCFRHLWKPIKTKENKRKHFDYCCCLEDSTIRTPVHTRETRMCGGYSANPPLLPGGQYTANQVQPSRLISWWRLYVRGHPLLRRVCTSVTHSVAFQANTNNETCRGFKIPAENLKKSLLKIWGGKLFFVSLVPRSERRRGRRPKETCGAWWAFANKAKSGENLRKNLDENL